MSMRCVRTMHHFRLLPVAFLLVLVACEHIVPSAPADDQTLDGPAAGLTTTELRQHQAGDRAFNDEVFTVGTGLGPGFVATSCGSCHAGDGKGHPSMMIIRFGQTDSSGNAYVNKGGPQLQYRAIPGYAPEVLPQDVRATHLVAPATSGLGFFEALTDAQILAHEDPNDADGDGISGVGNFVHAPWYVAPTSTDVLRNGRMLGRFGKKASAINLLHQTVNAYNQDMGITSTFEPIDTYTGALHDPEVTDKTVADVVFYLRTLKAPVQRDASNDQVRNGSRVFHDVGCDGCHLSTLTTPPSYTDLLLHDMGPGLDDGYTEGTALTSEWRTAPLWGLGLAPKAQGGTFYLLHDGRATSIHDAIILHGGEAARSAQRYLELLEHDRQDLLRFLGSL